MTFRLGDTLPKDVLEQYRLERDDLVNRAKALKRELLPYEKQRSGELHAEKIEAYLDAGHGACWLKYPEIGKMVAHALRYFDGARYILHAWVVMPNHVHAVLTPLVLHTLSEILHSWKSFTAHEVLKVARAFGLHIPKDKPFWQKESYDHLVRDNEDFERACRYTFENPVKAGLCATPEDWPFSGISQEHSAAGAKAGKAAAAGKTGLQAGTPALRTPARRIAVKLVDDRSIESLKVMEVEE